MPAVFREPRVESASSPPRRPGPYPCRVLGSGSAFHSGENPGFSRRAALQFRNRRPDLPARARSAAPAPGSLHRGRHAGGVRSVGARRAASAHGSPGRARLRPRGGAVPARNLLGCDLENQSARASLARSGVPKLARAGDVLPARVREQSRPENAAQLLPSLRSARVRSSAMGHRPKKLLGGGRSGRRNTPLSAGDQKAGAGTAPARSQDRKSTRLNSSHLVISYAVFCLKKKKKNRNTNIHVMLH